MGNLIGLPGVKGGKIADVSFAKSVSGAMKVLRTHRAVTGAGDHGAWTVWRDDDGKYRCDFSRHRVTVNEIVADTKRAVRGWLTAWVPAATGGAALAEVGVA